MIGGFRIGALVTGLLGIAAAGYSQVTEPRGVVGPGVMELEVGASDTSDRTTAGAEQSLAGPQFQLRVGTHERFEWRLRSDGFVSALATSPLGGIRTAGRADATIEAKLQVLDERRAGVELAVMPALTMPTGSPAMTGDCWGPALRVTFARALPRGFDAMGALGVWRESGDAGTLARQSVNLAVMRTMSSVVDAFVEGALATPAGPGAAREGSLDAGVIFHSGPNLEFHAQLVRGITRDAADWSAYASIVMRRPRKALADQPRPAAAPSAVDTDTAIAADDRL